MRHMDGHACAGEGERGLTRARVRWAGGKITAHHEGRKRGKGRKAGPAVVGPAREREGEIEPVRENEKKRRNFGMNSNEVFEFGFDFGLRSTQTNIFEL